MNRRSFVCGSAVVALPALAGCAAIGPDPRVVNAEAEAGFLDTLFSQAEIEVTVMNEGRQGNVAVFVEIYDGAGTVLDRFGEEIFMREDETRRVTIRVSVDEDAQRFEAFAEPA